MLVKQAGNVDVELVGRQQEWSGLQLNLKIQPEDFSVNSGAVPGFHSHRRACGAGKAKVSHNTKVV